MRLVEVIPGVHTSPELVTAAPRFVATLGHTAVHAKDTPGFVVNHLGRALPTESLALLSEGVASVADIDRIARDTVGLRMGHFELMDLIGLDVSHPVMEIVSSGFYADPRLRPSVESAGRFAGGLLGRKTGEGFYRYRDDDAPDVQPETRIAAAADAIPVFVHDKDAFAKLLRTSGVHVIDAPSETSVAVVFPVGEPDLVVLDLGLPGLPGDEVARLLRKDNDVPIVMLTAKASENDRVAGLRLGADDYMVKPFSPRELVARVEAVLRRSGAMRTDISTEVAYGGGRLRIDGERREVRVDGALVELTRSEFDLLAALASRPGRAWVRLELVSRIQGYAFEAYERTIDVHVKNLRRKLGDIAPFQLIATVPGIGYKLGVDRDA